MDGPPQPTCVVDFLGTGNYLAVDRYWNSFVLDGNVLVEPSPIVLPHLRRAGLTAAGLDVVVISHFHADHTFGWPFLLLELLRTHSDAPLFVVGPPGVQAYLDRMMEVGGVPDVLAGAMDRLDLHFVDVDGSWQQAGDLRLRAVEVDHVPHLECFGYLFELGGRTIAYSGDTKPCPGLDELAAAADVLILECNGPHPDPPVPVTHMDLAAVEALRRRFPSLPLVLTHLGAELDLTNLPDTRVPGDLERIEI